MNIAPSPQKGPAKRPKAQEKGKRPAKPLPPAPFFAPKNTTSAGPEIPSSSPAFATPAHPLRPFHAPAPAKAAVLPIILPPATLRPLAFRTFTKKHNLTLTSSALQELATFIGRHCGSGWREEGLAEKVLEEVSRGWKSRNGGVIVDGGSAELKDILKNLEGNMAGGKIISGPRAGTLSRQNSLLLDSSEDHSKTRLGLRPAAGSASALLSREDSQATSFGVSGMNLDDPDNGAGVKRRTSSVRDPRRWLRVVGAFDQPRFSYNASKKHFEKVAAKPSLLPPPSRKTEAFRNRLAVVHQRLMRNELFQSSSVHTSAPSHRLTPVANLLGRHGSTHMLLGMLIILPTGNLAISDFTGTIALDLSHAVMIPADSAWFTPGMIVLVDGVYEEEEESAGKGLGGTSGVGGLIGGRFQGLFIGQPPCEKRKVTLGTGNGEDSGMVGGGFGWIDFLGVGSERAVGGKMRRLEGRLLRQHQLLADGGGGEGAAGRGRVVILGEVNLDQPRSLQALRKVLGLYAHDGEGSSPMTFVVTGNFTANAAMASGSNKGGSIEYKEAFDGLAGALADFPGLLTTATFVFVPGDNDGWVSAFSGGAAVPLPRKGIPELFTSRVRRVFASANSEAGLSGGQGGEAVWTTNPSRLSLFGPNHEIVLFRDDISARLRRASVRLKSGNQNQSRERAGGDQDVTMSGAVPPRNEDAMDVDEDPPSAEDKEGGEEEEVPYDIKAARKLVKTLLDQGYLAPFRQSARPVHWDYTTPMYLYPLPTAMVLMDTTAPPFCVTYEACHVMNPGSILVSGRKGVARWIEYEVGRVGKVRECTF
ncbi:DNA polymerase alpha/epsilon subunit B-domain-containing protein [Cladorrhinum samala]|uniref:DNA polymerase epsilon subunit B n=1 Tax=Cladorrhinum samala TaxID=585594 RepID=A0AAV9HD40_9PEZI|nr:DNA polymerase alpha/epsilon subunit B-domain-containing protein [Cladorrhinum samala]